MLIYVRVNMNCKMLIYFISFINTFKLKVRKPGAYI